MCAQLGQLLAQGLVFGRQLGHARAQGWQLIGVGAFSRLRGLICIFWGGFFAGFALGFAHALGGLFELVLACSDGRHLFFRGQGGHGGRGVERDGAGLHRRHQLRRCLLLDFFNHDHLAAAQAGRARNGFAAAQVFGGRHAGRRRGGGGRAFFRLRFCLRIARHKGSCRACTALRHDLALAQRQHATLKVRHAAAAQVLVNHPQVHIFHRLEARVLHGLEGQAVLLANAVAVVAVHQHIAPQHQGIAATLGQNAALQRIVFFRGQGVDVGFEFFVDNDVHGVWARGRVFKAGAAL